MEKQYKETKEWEETLQLPLDSEKVQQLIVPLREEALKKYQAAELSKVVTCYKEAVWKMERTAGEKQPLSVDVKVVYAKRSHPAQEFVYEKKYPWFHQLNGTF